MSLICCSRTLSCRRAITIYERKLRSHFFWFGWICRRPAGHGSAFPLVAEGNVLVSPPQRRSIFRSDFSVSECSLHSSARLRMISSGRVGLVDLFGAMMNKEIR